MLEAEKDNQVLTRTLVKPSAASIIFFQFILLNFLRLLYHLLGIVGWQRLQIVASIIPFNLNLCKENFPLQPLECFAQFESTFILVVPPTKISNYQPTEIRITNVPADKDEKWQRNPIRAHPSNRKCQQISNLWGRIVQRSKREA